VIALLDELKAGDSRAVIARTIKEIDRRFPRNVEVAASLARILADSGKKFSSHRSDSADVASTGGPASLSTLLAPLYLRAAGIPVAKLGVPGRPAGGIDCLAQISGYRIRFTIEEAESIYKRTGFVHFLADGEAAPLDRRMFEVRQEIGAQAVPTLVAASLLAKKLVANVRFVGLDVRVAVHGNFGGDWNEAKRNALFFRAVAKALMLSAAPVLTDGEFPYQPFLGRGESLLALANIFDGNADSWLREHDQLCQRLALQCVPHKLRPNVAKVSPSELRDVFLTNVRAQSGSPESFVQVTNLTKAGHTAEIVAHRSGFVTYSLRELRDLFVGLQRRAQTRNSEFPDPIGLILLRRPGEWVEKTKPLATMRISPKNRKVEVDQIKSMIYTKPQSIGPTMESLV
jgi:pyrimidine-nucleoside phosphorylase